MSDYKVLLIDDNIDMLVIGERIFTRAGFDFMSARRGQDGLEKAKIEKPDTIVLEYLLPDLNGTEFLRNLATFSEYEEIRNTPVVFLTARPNFIENLDGCFRWGLRAFLDKPFGHRELVNIVENIIRMNKIKEPYESRQPVNGNIRRVKIARPLDDSEWFDDLKLATGAIEALCYELYSNEQDNNLSEQQKMDIHAIYSSSKRLRALIEQKSPVAISL
ncbi:MAG: response regulator [Actinobacteria bacterium]|nr:response regulator [Actinomycetota bacterium]